MEKRRGVARHNGGITALLCLVCVLAFALCGCDALGSVVEDTPKTPQSGGQAKVSSGPPRDTMPVVLVPEAPGEDVTGNDKVTIDISNKDKGYITVFYEGDNQKPKMQAYFGGGTDPYTYNLANGEGEVFPLSQGDGRYKIEIHENIEGTRYSQLFSGVVEVEQEDEFLPFLYPNQYVDFTKDSEAVAAGAQIAEGAVTELDVVRNIYNYIADNIAYDYDKAELAASGGLAGYLPDIDETLETKKGICFDYAALATAMLRTQRIPTKLVIGYSGEYYHAWIKVYSEETGWVDAIEFYGDEWQLLDPTFAATGSSQYVGTGDQSGYNEMFVY